MFSYLVQKQQVYIHPVKYPTFFKKTNSKSRPTFFWQGPASHVGFGSATERRQALHFNIRGLQEIFTVLKTKIKQC